MVDAIRCCDNLSFELFMDGAPMAAFARQRLGQNSIQRAKVQLFNDRLLGAGIVVIQQRVNDLVAEFPHLLPADLQLLSR